MNLITRLRRASVIALMLAFAGFFGSQASASTASTTQVSVSTAQASYKSCGSRTKTVNLPTLRRGDTGPCVKYAQGLLLAHEVMIGTAGPDGSFGPGTQTGVKNFQMWFKVAGGADGVIGQNTWKALRTPYVNPV